MRLDAWKLIDHETKHLGDGLGNLVRNVEDVIGLEPLFAHVRWHLNAFALARRLGPGATRGLHHIDKGNAIIRGRLVAWVALADPVGEDLMGRHELVLSLERLGDGEPLCRKLAG